MHATPHFTLDEQITLFELQFPPWRWTLRKCGPDEEATYVCVLLSSEWLASTAPMYERTEPRLHVFSNSIHDAFAKAVQLLQERYT